MDVKTKKKFKEYKECCRRSIQRPDFIPDDWRWASTYHILRTYFAYCITDNVIDDEVVDLVCEDIGFIKIELISGFEPEDVFLYSLFISETLGEWLSVALELELFEVAQNLKNIFDFCE